MSKVLLLSVIVCVALIIGFAAYFTVFRANTRTSWVLAEPPIGTELHINVYRGGCESVDRLAVQETAATILIHAFIRGESRKGPCPEVILMEPRTVQLNAPVDGRVLNGCNPRSSVYHQLDVADTDCAAPIRLGPAREDERWGDHRPY